MLSPLIWVWPTGSIRKVLFPGRLLAWAELSGSGFTPVPHSQGFYFEARVSLFLPHVPPDMSDRLNSMWAAQQTTKIIHLCLKTVKSGSNKGSLPIDPVHWDGQCQRPPLEGSVAQARSSTLKTLAVQMRRHYGQTEKIRIL